MWLNNHYFLRGFNTIKFGFVIILYYIVDTLIKQTK